MQAPSSPCLAQAVNRSSDCFLHFNPVALLRAVMAEQKQGLRPGDCFATTCSDRFAPVRILGRGCSWSAVQGVWASMYNERAMLSMKKVGIDFRDIRMAVLCQRVVQVRLPQRFDHLLESLCTCSTTVMLCLQMPV